MVALNFDDSKAMTDEKRAELFRRLKLEKRIGWMVRACVRAHAHVQMHVQTHVLSPPSPACSPLEPVAELGFTSVVASDLSVRIEKKQIEKKQHFASLTDSTRAATTGQHRPPPSPALPLLLSPPLSRGTSLFELLCWHAC